MICSLNDDTVLDCVQLVDAAQPDASCDPSSAVIQAIVLCHCSLHYRMSSSDDPVKKESSRAYIDWVRNRVILY